MFMRLSALSQNPTKQFPKKFPKFRASDAAEKRSNSLFAGSCAGGDAHPASGNAAFGPFHAIARAISAAASRLGRR